MLRGHAPRPHRLPAGQEAAAAGAPGTYAFDESAPRVEGALSTADAVRLETGRTYRSTLPVNGLVHYRLELDDTSNVYASATAVPPGGGAAVIDGVKVSVQDGDGRSCDVDRQPSALPPARTRCRVGRAQISPRRSLCKDAGYTTWPSERADPDGKGASPDAWELELTTVSEGRRAGRSDDRAGGVELRLARARRRGGPTACRRHRQSQGPPLW
ncbi:hypothetical protein SHIRM173S_09658 [Streptomyces hirsutus]